MGCDNVFFAGGGTGGHIYPAIAVAQKATELNKDINVHFFCSDRPVDSRILSKAHFSFTRLPAQKFSLSPAAAMRFVRGFFVSEKTARQRLKDSHNAVVVGCGGFVSAPVCRAAYKLGIPVKLINVDIIAGGANRLCARWAKQVFVQFRETADYFAGRGLRVDVVGSPLRKGFDNPSPEKAKTSLGLSSGKKVLLVTGASSGSVSINETICSLLDKLEAFADSWQVVHLTGIEHVEKVKQAYEDTQIENKVLGYYDDMADLLAASDLVIGRSGAVSVAEYAAAGTPSICMPYPHHRDMQQYLNAEKLVEAGAAIVVDDLPDAEERRQWLWEELEPLLKDDAGRQKMKQACAEVAQKKAAEQIARKLLSD